MTRNQKSPILPFHRASATTRKIYWPMGFDQHEFSYIFYTTGAYRMPVCNGQ